MVVNKDGKRFINEEENQVSFNMGGGAMKNQPGRIAFLIFDDATMTRLEEHGTEYSYMIFPAEKIVDGKKTVSGDRSIKRHNKHVFACDSIEELAGAAEYIKSICLKPWRGTISYAIKDMMTISGKTLNFSSR